MGMRDSNWFLIGIESSGDCTALGWGGVEMGQKHLEYSRNQKLTTVPGKEYLTHSSIPLCVLDKTKEEKKEFLSGDVLGEQALDQGRRPGSA